MKQQITIENASSSLHDLAEILDSAYWEASTIDKKDSVYNIIHIIQAELGELAKLSIQDHHLSYEPVTKEMKHINTRLTQLRKHVDDMVMRESTSVRLTEAIAKVLHFTG